jgi:DNA-binding NarL/FixJ family response regulator
VGPATTIPRGPGTPVDEVRVLLLGDDPLARSALAALLAAEPGLLVAAQGGAGEDGVGGLDTHGADAALWDLGLDAREGLASLRALAGAHLPVLALLGDDKSAAEALAAGARGVLLRETEGRRLGAALRALARGLFVLDDALAPQLLAAGRPLVFAAAVTAAAGAGGAGTGHAPPAEALTPRELEVLQLLAQGLPNKLIAQRLGISDHTAKFHVNAIIAKLGVQSRTEAVVRAARLGLVML